MKQEGYALYCLKFPDAGVRRRNFRISAMGESPEEIARWIAARRARFPRQAAPGGTPAALPEDGEVAGVHGVTNTQVAQTAPDSCSTRHGTDGNAALGSRGNSNTFISRSRGSQVPAAGARPRSVPPLDVALHRADQRRRVLDHAEAVLSVLSAIHRGRGDP